MRAIVLFVFMSAAAASGCAPSASDGPVEVRGCRPVSYGNETVYFPCVEAEFGSELSAFLRKNRYLEVSAMCGDGNGTNGRNLGYWVVTKNRPGLKPEALP